MDERVALVTGGTRGIGFGCAETLAREGWKLAVCGVRTESEARDALQELRETAREVLYVQADVSEDGTPQRLVGAVTARYGRLDLLVDNAGVAPAERKDTWRPRRRASTAYCASACAVRSRGPRHAREPRAERRPAAPDRRVHLFGVGHGGLDQPR